MISRGALIVTIALFAPTALCRAQSGGASLHGWVAFENVAYVDKQPRAKVRFQHDPPESSIAFSTETDEHGSFDFPRISLGRFKLEIRAEGFQTYSADVYVPSDFVGNWAVQLRTVKPKSNAP
jgi:hypothetical protein